MNKKKVIIVDKQDQEIGFKYRDEIETGRDIYRCTGIWITNKENEVLIAQCSFSKSHDPGRWGPAVAGTVEEGETYESNAIKELEEEIGIKNIVLTIGPKVFMEKCFAQIFFSIIDKTMPLVLQKDEVEQVKWIDKKILIEDIKKNPESYVSSMADIIDLII